MSIHRRTAYVAASILTGLGALLGAPRANAGNPQPIVVAPPIVLVRPPPPPPVAGCSLWEGMIHGNDPSVMVRMRLCQAGSHVFGRLQWSSLRSGWNERDVDGIAQPGGEVVLRDVRIVASAPAPGVRFCAIDRYAFRFASPILMLGNYDSFACNDHAVVELHRI